MSLCRKMSKSKKEAQRLKRDLDFWGALLNCKRNLVALSLIHSPEMTLGNETDRQTDIDVDN